MWGGTGTVLGARGPAVTRFHASCVGVCSLVGNTDMASSNAHTRSFQIMVNGGKRANQSPEWTARESFQERLSELMSERWEGVLVVMTCRKSGRFLAVWAMCPKYQMRKKACNWGRVIGTGLSNRRTMWLPTRSQDYNLGPRLPCLVTSVMHCTVLKRVIHTHMGGWPTFSMKGQIVNI